MRHWNTLVVLSAAAALTAVVADNTLTAICLSLLGDTVYETNKLSAHLMNHWGTNWTMTANALWSLVVIIWFCQRGVERESKIALLILLALAGIRGFAAWNNLSILQGALL
jgi:hypothetical protein